MLNQKFIVLSIAIFLFSTSLTLASPTLCGNRNHKNRKCDCDHSKKDKGESGENYETQNNGYDVPVLQMQSHHTPTIFYHNKPLNNPTSSYNPTVQSNNSPKYSKNKYNTASNTQQQSYQTNTQQQSYQTNNQQQSYQSNTHERAPASKPHIFKISLHPKKSHHTQQNPASSYSSYSSSSHSQDVPSYSSVHTLSVDKSPDCDKPVHHSDYNIPLSQSMPHTEYNVAKPLQMPEYNIPLTKPAHHSDYSIPKPLHMPEYNIPLSKPNIQVHHSDYNIPKLAPASDYSSSLTKPLPTPDYSIPLSQPILHADYSKPVSSSDCNVQLPEPVPTYNYNVPTSNIVHQSDYDTTLSTPLYHQPQVSLNIQSSNYSPAKPVQSYHLQQAPVESLTKYPIIQTVNQSPKYTTLSQVDNSYSQVPDCESVPELESTYSSAPLQIESSASYSSVPNQQQTETNYHSSSGLIDISPKYSQGDASCLQSQSSYNIQQTYNQSPAPISMSSTYLQKPDYNSSPRPVNIQTIYPTSFSNDYLPVHTSYDASPSYSSLPAPADTSMNNYPSVEQHHHHYYHQQQPQQQVSTSYSTSSCGHTHNVPPSYSSTDNTSNCSSCSSQSSTQNKQEAYEKKQHDYGSYESQPSSEEGEKKAECPTLCEILKSLEDTINMDGAKLFSY